VDVIEMLRLGSDPDHGVLPIWITVLEKEERKVLRDVIIAVGVVVAVQVVLTSLLGSPVVSHFPYREFWELSWALIRDTRYAIPGNNKFYNWRLFSARLYLKLLLE
jgi:hypothetical protein